MVKKFRVNLNTTFGQARARGITKKEWSRRVKISKSLRLRKKVISKPIKIKKKKEVQKQIVVDKRIRKQIVLNLVNRDSVDTGLMYMSIRAITINPHITEKGLYMALEEGKRTIERQIGINLQHYDKAVIGIEVKELGTNEDTNLNDYKVHIELFYNGKVQRTYKL